MCTYTLRVPENSFTYLSTARIPLRLVYVSAASCTYVQPCVILRLMFVSAASCT
jgi:hypothetical protein